MFKLATDLSATKNRSYFSTESIEESIQPIQYQNDNCSMFIKNLTLLSSAEHVHLGKKIIYHNNRITIKVKFNIYRKCMYMLHQLGILALISFK